ncbi:RNB-domain-containing protein [Violaceomyces palustris]|uniref:RNB-domain-containing protein n=1 Tax=Violaceomyces palustris TaxID=1673888 RepID=A0ACD0NQE6_9BASI|nr:RNB-domain-containing protein [Violaceomyces palustris]
MIASRSTNWPRSHHHHLSLSRCIPKLPILPPSSSSKTTTTARTKATANHRHLTSSSFSTSASHHLAGKKDWLGQRERRIAEKVIRTSGFGKNPPRPPRGDHPDAGWKLTPGPSSRRSVGVERPTRTSSSKSSKRDHARCHPRTDKGSPTSFSIGFKEAMAREQGFEDSQGFLRPSTSALSTQKMNPGDFVEIRRAGQTLLGVILPPPSQDELNVGLAPSVATSVESEIFVLASTGIVILFRESDVMIRLPRLVEPELAHSATPESRMYVADSHVSDSPTTVEGASGREEGGSEYGQGSSDPMEATSAVEEPIDLQRFRARAFICSQLRLLQIQAEKEMTRILPAFRDLFLTDREGAVDGDGEQGDRMDVTTGTITTHEAARLLQRCTEKTEAPTNSAWKEGGEEAEIGERKDGGRISPTTQIEASTLLATHNLLMSHPALFSADTLAHRKSHLFVCRPEEDRRVLDQVSEWVKAEPGQIGHEVISKFCDKAKAARSWYLRSREDGLLSDLGDPQVFQGKGPDVEWDENDEMVIAFLKASLGSRREIQSDIFGSYAMAILKRSGIEISPPPTPYLASQEEEHVSELMKSPFNELYADLGFSVQAGPDLQHAAVVTFLKEIGALAPWDNLTRLDTNFRALTQKEKQGLPEDSPPPANPAGKQGSFSSVPSKSKGNYVHTFDQAEEALRHDFGRDLAVYVIDDASAFELDDGISIEPVAPGSEQQDQQYWIHVHVADPTASIRPGDPLASRAKRRYSSLYFPEARWALLPDEFTTSGVGLRASSEEGSSAQGQRVFTMSAKVDARSGEVSDIKVRPGLVHKVKVISYDEVDIILNRRGDKDGREEERRDLERISRVSKALLAWRIKAGAVYATRPTMSISLSPLPLPDSFSSRSKGAPTYFTGFPTIQTSLQAELEPNPDPKGHSTSKVIVAEMMILAGRVAATFGEQRGLPLPYRCQPPPSDQRQTELLLSLRDEKTGQLDFDELVTNKITIPAGHYSSRPGQHFSLGIPNPDVNLGRGGGLLVGGGYCRATSPLRRYPDMVTHWQLRSWLVSGGRRSPFDRETIQSNLPQFERMDQMTKSLHSSSSRMWFCHLFSRILSKKRESSSDELGLTQVERRLLGPHEAIVVVTDVRTDRSTLQSRIRVFVKELGIAADCEWDQGPSVPPERGESFKVEVVHSILAGVRSAVLVRRV